VSTRPFEAATTPAPRAPSVDAWSRLSEAERARLVAALPADMPEAMPSEGDRHLSAKVDVRDVLRSYFQRAGRRIYVAAELTVYYPDEARFAPDVLAVADVDPREREKWVVSAEGKGLDWVMEIVVSGDRRKDLVENVERYARLGIAEYFVHEPGRAALHGFRLPAQGRRYEPIVPQQGRWTSRVLGLDLSLEPGRVRFFQGTASLLDQRELAERLEAMIAEVTARAGEEARRAEEEARRAEEERARADRLAARLRALGEDPDRDG